MRDLRTSARLLAIVALGATAVALPLRAQESLTFRSGVDLVQITATVTDENGRFVPGLQKGDFAVYDDDARQEIVHFSDERTPVSLGILMDVSGSMTAEKMAAMRAAINRFVVDLLDAEDEIFLGEFADTMRVLQPWTSDRSQILQAANRARSAGGTALYEAIAEALPLASAGRHDKKALLVLSDGNDTDSDIPAYQLRQAIRESDVLVYAIGIDSRTPSGRPVFTPSPGRPPSLPPGRPPTTQPPFPMPIPRPGGRRPFLFQQLLGGARPQAASGDRVNADALRRITDDTGGRTEIVRRFDDLDAATARIAHELSQQYALAYQSPRQRDGQWHTLRVEVARGGVTVRARRGYLAS